MPFGLWLSCKPFACRQSDWSMSIVAAALQDLPVALRTRTASKPHNCSQRPSGKFNGIAFSVLVPNTHLVCNKSGDSEEQLKLDMQGMESKVKAAQEGLKCAKAATKRVEARASKAEFCSARLEADREHLHIFCQPGCHHFCLHNVLWL